MSISKFKDGQVIYSLVFPDDGILQVGLHKCESITVIMENGEMAPVAWFLAVVDGVEFKHNGKYVAAVKVA